MARPREFNEDQVLEAAGDAFRTKGYEGTTAPALARIAGFAQRSLYKMLGNRRGLFLRAFKDYVDHNLRRRIARLESTQAPSAAITAFFCDAIERLHSDPLQRSCMLINSAVGAMSDDVEFRKAAASELTQLRAFFLRCMAAACQSGEIPITVSPEEAATQLLVIFLDLRVLACVNPRRPLLRGMVTHALALLGLPSLLGRQ
ncbi:TetR/AcrR family transcriptional regulator [Paraburkholderia oxyphila]|uniref:TetR/AcrR family transcriptional regulator n=1 Tax=Paraburkholderia oxyphila TaxID=614212 RepID=UPI000483D87D|nr:TetR/AcrR family transcriptional regulator [Paraburkholderia oxyphila]